MDPSFLKATMDVSAVIRSYDVVPPEWHSSDTYESIIFPEGYEKPTKEEFEAKLKELIDAQPLKNLRQERNTRLAEVDWVVIRAFSMNTPVTDEWKTYMQALRDLPTATEDPANVVWPEKPMMPIGETSASTVETDLQSEKSKVVLLQNVVFNLSKRIQALESA